jgi:hypothetical protein
MTEARNDGLHERHPGKGCSTTIVAAEAVNGEPEVGGVVFFLPSGKTKVLGWRQPRPIAPPLDAAKEFTAKVVQQLLDEDSPESRADVNGTNWTSVVAAVQRIILDWNDGIEQRINNRKAQLLRQSILH